MSLSRTTVVLQWPEFGIGHCDTTTVNRAVKTPIKLLPFELIVPSQSEEIVRLSK